MANLFGQEDKPKTRYADGTREKVAPWNVRDDLAIWPILLACQSSTADIEARRWLCAQFGRQAKLHGPRRKQSEYAAAEWSIINDRVVTRHIANKSPDVMALAAWLFAGDRTGTPITWGEYYSILRPYDENKNEQPRIIRAELRMFLDRHPTDADLLRDCHKPEDLGSVLGGIGRPARETNRERLAAALKNFREVDNDDYVLTSAWELLCQAARS